jgi:spore coat polysaccharide biosynthesis protein SpsF
MKPRARIVTVIQARRRSSRLPNKVLLPIAGRPLLARMLDRVRRARLVGTIVVATSTNPEDVEIQALCQQEDILCMRLHPTDLLDRHFRAARVLQADHVVKIPSDCPLIDPTVIDRVLTFYLRREGWFDYVSNLHPASYPDGNDVEVMSFAALKTAWKEASSPMQREHTTPFLWDNPDRFRVGNVHWETGLNYSSSHRWTIDYPEDYELIRRVFEALLPTDPRFSLRSILRLLTKHRELAQINSKYVGVNWYRHHLGELKTISASDTRFPEDETIHEPELATT